MQWQFGRIGRLPAPAQINKECPKNESLILIDKYNSIIPLVVKKYYVCKISFFSHWGLIAISWNNRELRHSYKINVKLLWIRDSFVIHSWPIRHSFYKVQLGGNVMLLHIIFAALYIFMTFSTLVFSLQQFSNNFEFSRMRLNKESRFAGCPLEI